MFSRSPDSLHVVPYLSQSVMPNIKSSNPAKISQRQRSVEGLLHMSQSLYSILYNPDGVFFQHHISTETLIHFPTLLSIFFRLFPQCLPVLKSRIQEDVFYCSYTWMLLLIQHIK